MDHPKKKSFLFTFLPSSSCSCASSISQSSSLTETLLRDLSPFKVPLSDSKPPSKLNSSGSAREDPTPYAISGISLFLYMSYLSNLLFVLGKLPSKLSTWSVSAS